MSFAQIRIRPSETRPAVDGASLGSGQDVALPHTGWKERRHAMDGVAKATQCEVADRPRKGVQRPLPALRDLRGIWFGHIGRVPEPAAEGEVQYLETWAFALGGRLVEFGGSTRDFPVQRTVAVLDEQHATLPIQNHCPRRRPRALRHNSPGVSTRISAHYSDRRSTNRQALRVARATRAFRVQAT
jgi:hypothetical protein